VVAALDGHNSIVNALASPPGGIGVDGCMLASAGLDEDVRMWAPYCDAVTRSQLEARSQRLQDLILDNFSAKEEIQRVIGAESGSDNDDEGALSLPG